ncbi:SDR family NAD(P)-dependent oxidoreductase [Kiloniella sp. b19]|uniref:SDR family NAD(P)-dependent oxidoreductase n=1 Tax=Kiloniella sp. GXU_MW_B19 TaxID=3141326 RepID=UPI0031DCC3F0
MTLPRTPSFRLDGRKALVAGGTSGIGLGCSVALAEAGAEVRVAARREAQVMQTVDLLREQGWKAEGVVLDVADQERTAQQVRELGPFDILVNSAGTARHSLAVETETADYDAVMDLNLRGAYFLTQAVAQGMIDAGRRGSIVNISSQMAHVGGMERAVYCASKSGVEGFSKAMAIELGQKGIRVNTVCPTFVRTPLTKPTFDDPDKIRWIESKIKLGRVAEIEDLMGPVLFLASDASAMITGTSLLVDGGWTAD